MMAVAGFEAASRLAGWRLILPRLPLLVALMVMAAPASARTAIVDEAVLQQEYAAYRQSLQGQKRFHVHYIRVATEQQARELIGQLRIGAPFAEIARQRSLHAESAARGGDLGVHASCRWSQATLKLLEELRPAQIGERPVKGSNGWGIYRLQSVEAIEPRSFETWRAQLLSGRFEPECPWTPPVTLR